MIYLTQALQWDVAIFCLIVGGLWLTAYAWRAKKRTLVSRILSGGIGFIIASIVLYGSFIEPQIITVTERQITLPTAQNITIAVLGDLHVGPYVGKRFVRRVVKKVNALSPDMVLLVGDFTYYSSDPGDSLNPLQDLSKAPLGVYAVLGNHDYGCFQHRDGSTYFGTFDASSRVIRALERMGVRVLRNESIEVRAGDDQGLSGLLGLSGPLFVAGLDDECSGRDNLAATLPKTTRKSSVILLAHDPSVILDKNTTYANLIVSGHTHGGQIRLPFLGPVVSLPTQLPHSYDQGLFDIDKNTTLAITRGLGEAGPRARLFAWPEIMVIRVR